MSSLLSLRYFNEVARLGSIRRAADHLHVAPSAVSRQMSLLEADLDTTLLQRSKAGVELTHAGEVYWRHTRKVLLDLTHAKQAVDDMRGLRRGEVSVWVIEGLVSDFLPRVIAAFHRRHPAIHFALRTTSTDQIVDALLEHEADIGITFNAAPRSEIQVIEELLEPIVCMVAPNHRLAQNQHLTVADIVQEPMALPESNFGLRQIIEQSIRRHRNDFKALVTTNSLELTKALAMSGEMIAFMPMQMVQKELRNGTLCAVPMRSRELEASTTSLSIHRDRLLSLAARELLKALREEMRLMSSKKAEVQS